MALENNNKYYLYCLIDPINNLPFYVGKGCGNRAFSHLKNLKNENNVAKQKTIDMIRLLNLEPRVEIIISNLAEDVAYDMEYIIIKNAKEYFGINLTNRIGIFKPPSRKGCKLKQCSKDKISAYQKGRKKGPMSYETKQKLSVMNYGKEGPNKVYVDVDSLKHNYIDLNFTKKEICDLFSIGLGSLNRILSENGIKKSKQCFAHYASRKRNIKI